jgi:hypothetical protein
MLFIFGGLAALITVFILSLPNIGYVESSKTLKQIAFILPNFAAAQVPACSIHDHFITSKRVLKSGST